MKHIKTISCLLAFVLLAGCVLFDEPVLNGNGNTNTKVRVNIGNNARTILPYFHWSFSKYVLSVEPIWDNEQDPPEPVTIDGSNDSGVIYVPYGNWKIIVTAYIDKDGTDYAVSNGNVELSVWDKDDKEVVIRLNFPESGGTGTFIYNVSYPEGGGNSVNVYLSEFGGNETEVIDESVTANGTDVIKSIPSGMYWLAISAYIDDKPIKRVEIVHIYPELETRANYNFIWYDAYEPCPIISNLSSSSNYEIVNLMDIHRFDVLKVYDPGWAVALYDLPKVELTVYFHAEVKFEGTAENNLTWRINNPDPPEYPSVGSSIDVEEGGWYYMSGTWTGTPNEDYPKLYLDAANRSGLSFYVDNFSVYVQTAFDTAEGLNGLTKDAGSGINIDPGKGIISREPNTGYGSWFSVAIPLDQLPIIPSDTIVVSYIAIGDVPLIPKLPNSYDSFDPPIYPTLIGDGSLHTLEIDAVSYGASIPTAPNAVLTFQGRPNTAEWQLKITDITVVHGDPIKVNLSIPTIKAPVVGETPLTTINSLQYTGAVSWSPDDATFEEGTLYTATITLTKKAGYTFNGITADSFLVAGATSVTNNAGDNGDTMTVTAVFPSAAEPAPDFTLTFNSGDVTGVGTNSITIFSDNTGYEVDQSANYGGGFAYFNVTFPDGHTLSEYSKIDFTITTISGDGNNVKYKPIYVNAFAGEPVSGMNTGINVIAGQSGTAIGDDFRPYNFSLDISADVSLNLNSVYILFTIWQDGPGVYEVSNIKFYN